MKRILLATAIVWSALYLLPSCQKKCTGTDTYNGSAIIHEVNGIPVIIYPEAGYMTSNMNGNYLIDESSLYADKFKVSFDKGYTKTAIDYNKYVIMANPKLIPCNGAVARTLEINYTFQTVTYTASPFSDCDAQCKGDQYVVENYILVDRSQLPSTFMVSFK